MAFLEDRFANRRRRRRRKGGRKGTDRGGGWWCGVVWSDDNAGALRDSLFFLSTGRSSNSQFSRDGMAWGGEGHRMLREVPSTTQMGRVFLGCSHIGRLNSRVSDFSGVSTRTRVV
ncbi:hypothetical protein GW17_00039719 [Ensete ventricosum]|nr:hypothetical protein GW17_00039719 [Ensete ventricosum]